MWKIFRNSHEGMPRSAILSVTLSKSTLCYTPGEIVSGSVTCESVRDETIRKIKINFVGKIVDSILYHFENTDHICFDRFITLAQSHKEDEDVFTLHKGRHKFPFAFELPSCVTSSFNYDFGYTVYYAEAILIRGAGKNTESPKIFFNIAAVLDLNNVISSTNSKSVSDTKEIVRCSGNFGKPKTGYVLGKLSSTLYLPKTGYVPGEFLRYDFKISNETSVVIETSITVCLFQNYKFTLNRISTPYARMTSTRSRSLPTAPLESCYYTQLSSVSKHLRFSPRGKKSCMGETLLIPLNHISTAIHTDDGCIQVKYELRMEIKICGMETMRLILPITIGTTPHRSDNEHRVDFIPENATNFPLQPASTILPDININDNYPVGHESVNNTEVSPEQIRLGMETPPPSYDELVADGAWGTHYSEGLHKTDDMQDGDDCLPDYEMSLLRMYFFLKMLH